MTLPSVRFLKRGSIMTEITKASSAEIWHNRAVAYELCAHGFLLPTRLLAEVLSSGEYQISCEEVLGQLGTSKQTVHVITDLMKAYQDRNVDELFHELRQAYTMLFVGEKLPAFTPFVGIFSAQQRGEDGVLFLTKESLDIERIMKRCAVGKNVEEGQSNDPLDHIGSMCEFLEFLCLTYAQAITPPDHAHINKDDYETIVDTYISPYAHALATQINDLTKAPFYQALAFMLEAVVQS